MLDHIDEFSGRKTANPVRILPQCRQLRLQMSADPDTVIPGDRHIPGNRKSAASDRINASKRSKIIRIEYTGRRFWKIEKLQCFGVGFVRIAVRRFQHIFIRNLESQIVGRTVEAGQTALRYRRIRAVDISDPAMPHLIYIRQQILHSPHVVRQNHHPVVKNMVDRHDRNIAADKFDNVRIVKIHACDAHAVKAAVPCVREIRHPVYS